MHVQQSHFIQAHIFNPKSKCKGKLSLCVRQTEVRLLLIDNVSHFHCHHIKLFEAVFYSANREAFQILAIFEL